MMFVYDNSAENTYFGRNQHPVKEKLRTFEALKKGWNFGEGAEISHEAISQASALVEECFENGFFELDVFPGLDGEVRLTIYKESNYYEFTVMMNTIVYIHEKDDIEQDCQEVLTLKSAVDIIQTIRKSEWSSSEYSIQSGTTSNANVFRVWLSNLAAEYPYLTNTVQSEPATVFAPI